MEINLSSISTADLVKELSDRAGVNKHMIDPYEEYTVVGEGPAIVLIVED